MVEYVRYPEFILVSVTLAGLVITGFWIMLVKMGNIGERVTTTETQNQNDNKNIDGIWNKLETMNVKMDSMESKRNEDVLQFTKVVGKLDTTLGKMEVTLERMDNRFETQDKEIAELRKEKHGNKIG